MKKILFVVDENKIGGVSILLEDMLKTINLKNKRIDVLVLHDSGDRLKKLPKEINVIYGSKYFDVIDLTIGEVIKTKNIMKLIKKIILVFDMKTGLIKNKIKRERKKILKNKYDIEIAFKDGFTAIFTAFGDSNKKIHWLHYNYKDFNPNAKYNKLFNNILSCFDNIIAVSENVMNDFNKLYHLEDKTNVIHNLIDIKKIMNNSKEEIKKEKKINIISVGRLHAIKGYDQLIDAVYKLNEENLAQKFNIKIYGDGPEKENLQNKILNYNLESVITLEGGTINPYALMKNADLFIMPSKFESFGLVAIESLILGTPVIATNTGVIDKVIINNFNGIIAENSIEGLYNGLKDILIDSKKIDLLKENAKSFDYTDQNNAILEKLEQLLK